MRKLIDHIVEGDAPQNQLAIRVTDEPGPGGANHRYEITASAEELGYALGRYFPKTVISFQNGPIKEAGVNGITQEALLAIVIDRLRSFQAGPFRNNFNRAALSNCEMALEALKNRTRERLERGVEGQTKA